MIVDAHRAATRRLSVPVIAGSLVLALRPAASVAGWLVILGVGALAVLMPLDPLTQGKPGRSAWIGAVTVGIAAFAAARILVIRVAGPGPLLAMAATGAAAVAEEAFFRRLCYGWLVRWGTAVAILGTAAAFAVVHIPGYGVWTVAVNFAAGVLLGWQRWATGGWSAAAVTHVIANVLQLI